jgi:trigger factor
MQVSVEATSKLERRLTVVVPVEQLDQAYDKRIVKFSKTAKVDGFRPGKIPLDYIKQRYGQAARQEALSEVIQTSLYEAINQEKLQPVGVPTVEPKSVLPGQPLEFVATFEVVPTLEAVKFDMKAIEKQVATITDADIEKVLTHLLEQHVVWQQVSRPAQLKDQAVIDFTGSIDGKPFDGGEAHEYPVILGSNTMIPGFEEGLVGLKTGDEKTIKVTFPANYFAEQFAGKGAEFVVKAIRISEPKLPELDEGFIKKLGIKSGQLDELRAEVRKNLDREVERVIKAKLKAQIFDHLLAQNEIEIPKALIEREAKRIHDEMHPHHAGEADHGHSEAEMAAFNEPAKRNVMLGLLVSEIIKQHSVTPDQQRIQAYITQLSSAYENPAEVAKWYLSNKRARAEIEMQVLEEQVTEKLLENIKITEKTLSYNELITGNK